MLTADKLLALGALVLGALVLILLLRRGKRRVQQHLASKAAAARADDAGRFELRHRAAAAGALVAYLRYEIQNRGTEDDYGIRCRFEARVGGGAPLRRDLGVIGPLSNPLPLEYEERVRVTHDASMVSGGIGYRHSGRIELGELTSVAAGEELTISGEVTPNEATRVDAVEVYLVPAARRL